MKNVIRKNGVEVSDSQATKDINIALDILFDYGFKIEETDDGIKASYKKTDFAPTPLYYQQKFEKLVRGVYKNDCQIVYSADINGDYSVGIYTDRAGLVEKWKAKTLEKLLMKAIKIFKRKYVKNKEK